MFEWEDLTWFSARVRGLMTDFLSFAGNLKPAVFEQFAQRLRSAMESLGERKILDLCSGSAGPLPSLVGLLAAAGYPVTAHLTDLYPNLARFRALHAAHPEVFRFEEAAVDAREVPEDLDGFRLLCNGFHHFRPADARRILADAVAKGRGIAVLEFVERTPRTLAMTALAPLMVLATTPFIRPLRVDRLLFTYVLPLVPLGALWDGLVSCMRVYSIAELEALTRYLGGGDYTWEMGKLTSPGFPARLTYLIGRPVSSPIPL